MDIWIVSTFLVMVNNAAVTFVCKLPCRQVLVSPGNGVKWGLCIESFEELAAASSASSQFLHILTNLGYLTFDFSQTSGHKVVSHDGFDLHFPGD